MGRMLDRLLSASPAYEIRPEANGYMLIGRSGHTAEFNDLVREAADASGDEFVVFPTSDGSHGYSQMFVMPMEADRR